MKKKNVVFDFKILKRTNYIPSSYSGFSELVKEGDEDDILNTKVLAWLKDNDLGIDGELNLCEHSKTQGSTHVTHKDFLTGLKLKQS